MIVKPCSSGPIPRAERHLLHLFEYYNCNEEYVTNGKNLDEGTLTYRFTWIYKRMLYLYLYLSPRPLLARDYRGLQLFVILFLLSSFLSCFQNDEEDDTPVVISEGFVSVAHRGYHPQGVAENSALAYRHAKLAGFDYGETDIQWTKDNIPVCCHDEYFFDHSTNDSISIRQHTLEELKRFDYHGTSISSLQEVMDTCKRYGLGLYLDRFTTFDKERRVKIFNMIETFGKEKVCYIFGNREVAGIQQVLDFDSCATIALLQFHRINRELVEFANSLSTSTNKVILDVDHSTNPTTALNQYLPMLKPNVHFSVFTINNKRTYKEYLPFVISITSDLLSARHLR